MAKKSDKKLKIVSRPKRGKETLELRRLEKKLLQTKKRFKEAERKFQESEKRYHEELWEFIQSWVKTRKTQRERLEKKEQKPRLR
jgi:hypothetical protein